MTGAIHRIWMMLCAREAVRFRAAMHSPQIAQAQRLREIVAANANSEYGRRHGFASIRTAKDFQECVPLTDYDGLHASIERIAAGVRNVLTCGEVRLLEPTSGTSGGEKLIPYTPGLRAEFQRAIAAWMHDLYSQRPALLGGRGYWSISPAFGPARRTSGGLSVGFDDDAAYLGTFGRRLIERILVRPPGIARVPGIEAFRYCTLLWLLGSRDLSLVSVWSPSFLTALIDQIEPWRERLAADIRAGSVTPPKALPPELAAKMHAAMRPDRRRAGELTSIFNSRALVSEKLRAVWPRLALISCWCDSASSAPAAELRRLFPDVEIQPKGLLATEACVSIPLLGREGAALALRSHFLEFQAVDTGKLHLAHELEQGGSYRVVVTTGGGLYRYQLGDEIEVAGFEHECPLVRFVGRAGQVSDLAGEKLEERHVRAALDRIFARRALASRWAMLAPVAGSPPCYCLYLALDPAADFPGLGLARELDDELSTNPHYRLALGLGQLAPARVKVQSDGGPELASIHEGARLAAGQKLGSIKPSALEKRVDVAAALARG